MEKGLSLLLAGALSLSVVLSSCVTQPENPSQPPSSPPESASVQPVGPSAVPAPTQTGAPSGTPAPEPCAWDPEHTLELTFTPAEGLELPVEGATGYASVRLPLWGQRPEGNEGRLVTIYAAPTPAPGPGPSETPAPAPTDPAPEESEPAPEESGVETPEPQPSESAPAEAGEDPQPVESAGADPAPAETDGEPSPEPTVEPAPEPTPEPTPEPAPDPMAGALLVLKPGTAFLILGESGAWWQVRCQGVTGWVEHRYCLVNLPDVIPSMIYNDTGSYASVLVSSGKSIPNITGRALYQTKAWNDRLGRQEFMMPVLYATAKSVCQAQQNALAEGNTLVLYQGFWPYSAQMAVVRNLTALSEADAEVKAGISTAPWNISWFVATGVSNHQEGYAIDVSLAKVAKAHVGKIGGYSVVQVDEYEEYTMPTPIQELSMASATYTKPVAIFSTTAWKSASMTDAMAANEPACALHRYCTSAKLTPLASEWWHFNDLAAHGQVRAFPSGGNYQITQCLSQPPNGSG